MHAEFLAELECWITALLRQKALASDESHPGVIGAADLAGLIADFVLTRLVEEPASATRGCGLDYVSDEAIMRSAGFDRDTLAAAFVGAAVELESWTGPAGIDFLVFHGVEPDDAEDFCAAVDAVSQDLGRRGRRLLALEDDESAVASRAERRHEELTFQAAR